jgi:hypothetical protein
MTIETETDAMQFSTTQTAEQLTARGVPTRASTIREIVRSGVFEARKNARGEAEFTDEEIDQLAQVIKARRAASLTAFHRGRIQSLEARRSARNGRHEVAATA